MPSRSLSAVKSYSLSGSTGKSTDFKGLTLPRAGHSAPLERRKYLALLWSNSCCFLFTAALFALGTREANCPAATAEVVLRCSEWGEKTKTHTYGSTCGIAQISEQHKYHIYLACQSKVWASIYWWGGATKPASDSICSLPSNCFVVLCHREQPLRNLRIVVNPGKWRKGRPHDSFHSKEIFSFPLCYCSSCFQSLNTNIRALHERYSSLGIITTAATDGSF